MSRLRIVALALVVASLAVPARAADDAAGTAYHFLNLGVGARLAAMGGAGTSLGEGVDAYAWNPALLARAPQNEFSGSWFNWADGVQSGHLAAMSPGPRGGALAFGLQALSVGEFSNVPGEPAIGQTDLAMTVAGGVPLFGGLSAGLGGKVVTSELAGERATGWALDGGLNFRWTEGWNLSGAVRNLGPAFGYYEGLTEELPTQASIGAAGTIRRLRFGLDGVWENGQGGHARAGAEYRLGEWLALRAGSRLGGESDRAPAPWSVGVGFQARPGLSLDYSFQDGELSASHRLGVRWAFGRSPAVAAAQAASPGEFYGEVLDEVIERSLADFPRDVGDTVVVRAAKPHAAAAVVAEAVAARLRSWGLPAEVREPVPEVPIPEDPVEAARIQGEMAAAGLGADVGHPLLEFEIRRSVYEYTRDSRERWVGPRTVERRALAELAFTLTDPGAEAPRWTGSGSSARDETVSLDRVPASGGYPPAPGKSVKRKGLHPLVEPAIVGGIVAGLAVIFFSNREVGN
jgi:hypothetical protein